MKESIRLKLFVFMSVLVLSFVAISWLAITFFLEKYYIHSKKETVFEAYHSVSSEFQKSNQIEILLMEKLENESALNLLILDKNFTPLYNSRQRMDEQSRRENGARSRNLDARGRDLESRLGEGRRIPAFREMSEELMQSKFSELSTSPVLEVRQDSQLKTRFISLLGKLDTDHYIFISTPVEAIKESVAVTNNFFIFTGFATLLIGTVLIFILSNRFTRPILSLNEIAKEMAKLDFTKKYPVSSKDEIGNLGQSINSLSSQLEKSILELQEANDQLKKDIEKKREIDEMRKEFISNVSHELKTPIALISGYAEGLKVNVNTDEENKNYYCDVILDESHKMNQLVGELLELAQLEAKELHLEKDIFQIGEMIQQNLKKNGILFESKKIQITFDSQSEDSVFGDYRKIEHVFNNYIQNAVNHVDEKKQIRITLSSQKGKLRVHVFNSGLPIPQESLDKIWQSFYKVDKARTRAYGGSGLGLSVVKAIMEAHNEAYGVENVADGVTFWFELEQK